MKRIFSLILVFMMCFTLFSCGFDQESYDTYLSGKSFESEGISLGGATLKGAVLSFDEDNCMEYLYTNAVGVTFRYTYSITKIEKNNDELTLTLKRVSSNNDIENIDKDENEEATYSISNKTINYYAQTYKIVK